MRVFPAPDSPMEFHIARDARTPEIAALENALLEHDAAAVIDLDAADGVLRLSTWLEASQVREILGRSGWALQPDRIVQQPSVCCGGCGG